MRISVARRNLFRQKTRLLMSVAGVGFAVSFVLVILGLYSSFKTKAVDYVSSIEADVWVGPAGAPMNLIANMSSLPIDAADGVSFVEGVASVRPFTGRLTVLFKKAGLDVRTYLVGVDTQEPLAAPKRGVGRLVPGPGEVVIDSVFAQTHGFGIGQTMTVKNEPLMIVGISDGTDVMGTPYTFVDLATSQKIFEADLLVYAPEMLGLTDSLASFFLVRVTEGQDPAVVAQRIDEAGVEFQPLIAKDFIKANLVDVELLLEPLLWVLVMIAFVVGAAIIGLTIYTATIEKAKEYGVLKAIGFSKGRLLRVVGAQSVVASVLGFVAGAGLAVIIGELLRWQYPMFTTRFTPSSVGGMFAVCVLMSVFAALIPARRIASIDPAEVFRV